MVLLGRLEQEQGEPDAARAADRQAIATGHADHAPAAAFKRGGCRHPLTTSRGPDPSSVERCGLAPGFDSKRRYIRRVPTFTATSDPGDDEPTLTAEQRAALARAISTPALTESIARFNSQFARIAEQVNGGQFRSIAEQVNATIGQALASQLTPALQASGTQVDLVEAFRSIAEAQLSTRKLMEPMFAQIAAQQQQWARALAVPLIATEQFQSRFQNLVVSSEFTEAMRRVRELSQVELEIPTEDGFDKLAALVESGEIDEATIGYAEEAIGSNVELSEAIDAAVDEFVKRRPLVPRKVVRGMIVSWVWLVYGGVLFVIAVATNPIVAAIPGAVGAPGPIDVAKKAGGEFDKRYPPETASEAT
jgi:hypothetical protein